MSEADAGPDCLNVWKVIIRGGRHDGAWWRVTRWTWADDPRPSRPTEVYVETHAGKITDVSLDHREYPRAATYRVLPGEDWGPLVAVPER